MIDQVEDKLIYQIWGCDGRSTRLKPKVNCRGHRFESDHLHQIIIRGKVMKEIYEALKLEEDSLL